MKIAYFRLPVELLVLPSLIKYSDDIINVSFPEALEREPEKQFCSSTENPYENYFPRTQTTVPHLQPIGLAMVGWRQNNL